MHKKLLLISLILFSPQSISSTKCPSKQKQLRSIQNQMRDHGVNEYLRDKEREAFTNYEKCRKRKNTQQGKNNPTYKRGQNKPVNGNKGKTSKLFKTGEFTSNVQFKSKFTGKKQNDWIAFYRKHQPTECIKPKSTSQFSKCIEYRNKASKYFEGLWRKQNPEKEAPPSIKLGHG